METVSTLVTTELIINNGALFVYVDIQGEAMNTIMGTIMTLKPHLVHQSPVSAPDLYAVINKRIPTVNKIASDSMKRKRKRRRNANESWTLSLFQEAI